MKAQKILDSQSNPEQNEQIQVPLENHSYQTIITWSFRKEAAPTPGKVDKGRQ